MSAPAATLARPTILDTFRAYIALTKPRVISLLLVTTVPAMLVAERGGRCGGLSRSGICDGSRSAGSVNVKNDLYAGDRESVMKPTRRGPPLCGQVEAAHGLLFGVILGAGAFVFMWAATTPAAATLSLAALLFYVFIYTMWLKRRTPQNIVIGGAAGAFPPMVGWAAVTGDVSWAAVVMFAIIFMWTPPHFWALSLRLKDDYADAGVPMLPVTAGVRHTRIQIVLYSIALIPVTLLLIPTGDLRWIYLATAVVGGVLFVWKSYELYRRPADISPISVYKFSMLYLAVLFMAMGADAVIFG